MAKKRKSKTQIEYERVRSNLLQNIRRLEKRGYDVGIDVPKRPDKITKKDVRELKDLNRRRYKFATYEISEVVGEPGYERIESVKITGYEARKRERKIAAGKGKATRISNQAKRDIKELQDYKKSHSPVEGKQYEYSQYEDYHITDPADLKTEKRPQDYIREEGNKVSQQPADYYNPETGEVISTHEHIMMGKTERSKFVPIMSQEAIADIRYNNVIQMLETMEYYDGYTRYDNKGRKHRSSKKHDEITRSNAEEIKKFIEQKYEEDPEGTSYTIAMMDQEGTFEAPELFYTTGGYNRFLSAFEAMFNYTRNIDQYDQNNDSNDYSDFEEDY